MKRPLNNIIAIHEPKSGLVYGQFTNLTDPEILKLNLKKVSDLVHKVGRIDYRNVLDFQANAAGRSEANWSYLFIDGHWQTYKEPLKQVIGYYPSQLTNPIPIPND